MSANLEVLDVVPPSGLLAMMREETILLGQPDIRPYADAALSIETFKLSELASTTRYIQEDILALQGGVRAALLSKHPGKPEGYDHLNLQDGRLLMQDANGVLHRLAPPVVERHEPSGDTKYILDGAHRAHLARLAARETGIEDPELTVIYVRDGISVPPYASPSGWDEVSVVAARPADKSTWKNYWNYSRRYERYRDYDRIFDSGPRGLDAAVVEVLATTEPGI